MKSRRFKARCLPCFQQDSTPQLRRRLLRCGISVLSSAAVANAVSTAVTGCVLILRSPRLALAFFTVSQLGRLGGQLLQPFGQAFELLVCVELVQAVNADLNRLGVVVGDTVDVFGAAHDLLIVAGAFILLVSRQ